MWVTKIIGVLAQLCVIILAILLVYQFSSKQVYEGRVDSIERDLNAKIDENRKYLNDKIIVQQDNVNRYIQLREDRANLFAQRLDTLYDLYKKDPAPIDKANITTAAEVVATTFKDPGLDKNFIYLENKCNKVDEKIDTLDSKIMSRISVLEQRVEGLQKDSKSGTKVINTNVNNNSFGAMAAER